MPIYCSCTICKCQVATSQLGKHHGSKLCLSGGKQIPLTECPYCIISKTLINKNFANHVKFCELNPNKQHYKNRAGVKYSEGRVAWNKGTGKKLDTRNPDLIGKQGGYRPNAGHSKKFKVVDSFGKDTVLQSSYELECANLLNVMDIKWNRPRAMKYGNRNYFADFYLTDYDVYLDPKNSYKAQLDADKIAAVISENSVKLYVLLKEQINKEYIELLIAVRPNGEVAS